MHAFTPKSPIIICLSLAKHYCTKTKVYTLNKFLFSIALFIITDLSAQDLTQTIRGKILDADSKSPIPFATVIIVGSEPLIGTTTDLEGYYNINAVPIGRVAVKVNFLGYEELTIPNLLVITGKETVLDIELKETFKNLEEVTISATKHKSESLNEMAQVSAKGLSVEESKRYAGGIGDPARLVSSFAGVGSTGDGNNDIIVRGNNPRYIQWKLEGTEIPNPNHFSQEGLTGGPISALNSQMLANSEFYTGAFAPEYGNALSGIFDMRLRNGNSEKREHSFSIGALGIDLTTEGPFKKGGKNSYLINYRYSTLGLLSNLGILDFGGVPVYQDISFKVLLPTDKAGTFSIFGLGGLNKINSEFYSPENEDIINEEFKLGGQLAIMGLKHLISLNEKVYINSTISHSYNSTLIQNFRIFNANTLNEVYNSKTYNNITRLNTTLNYKYSARNSFKLGFVNSIYNFNFYSKNFDNANSQFKNELDVLGNANLFQSFINWKWRATEKLSIVTGVHNQKASQNHEITIEPRASVRYDLPKGQSVSVGIGFHSNMTSLVNYNAIVYDSTGNYNTPNKNMELLKAKHYVLGYENKLSKQLYLKLEGYYQELYSIPIEPTNSSYSLINQRSDFSNRVLINEGKGRNIGLELTLEKYFYNNYYYLFTASLFDSKYLASDNIWRNTRFNGNFIFNGLFGKEFAISTNKNNILGINTKINWMGGNRLLNVNLEESIQQGSTVYDELNAFNDKGDDLFSLNLSINYRVNKPKFSYEFKIDIQNITNNSAVIERYYSEANKRIEDVNQLSLLPILSYTINF
jgi:hypothetical protein